MYLNNLFCQWSSVCSNFISPFAKIMAHIQSGKKETNSIYRMDVVSMIWRAVYVQYTHWTFYIKLIPEWQTCVT